MKTEFVWDNNKNKTNIQKHGISFEEAKYSFYDVNSICFFDEEHSTHEDRYILLGISYKLRLLTVSYCHIDKHPNKDVIRIISSRKATKKEIQFYNGGKNER